MDIEKLKRGVERKRLYRKSAGGQEKEKRQKERKVVARC